MHSNKLYICLGRFLSQNTSLGLHCPTPDLVGAPGLIQHPVNLMKFPATSAFAHSAPASRDMPCIPPLTPIARGLPPSPSRGWKVRLISKGPTVCPLEKRNWTHPCSASYPFTHCHIHRCDLLHVYIWLPPACETEVFCSLLFTQHLLEQDLHTVSIFIEPNHKFILHGRIWP